MFSVLVSVQLTVVFATKVTSFAFKVGSFMFGVDMPCQILLCRECGGTNIANESHLLGLHALKVGDKLRNTRNAPLFITLVA